METPEEIPSPVPYWSEDDDEYVHLYPACDLSEILLQSQALDFSGIEVTPRLRNECRYLIHGRIPYQAEVGFREILIGVSRLFRICRAVLNSSDTNTIDFNSRLFWVLANARLERRDGVQVSVKTFRYILDVYAKAHQNVLERYAARGEEFDINSVDDGSMHLISQIRWWMDISEFSDVLFILNR